MLAEMAPAISGIVDSWRAGVLYSMVVKERTLALKSAKETTLARRVEIAGAGLHTAKAVEIAICPAEAGAGVYFEIMDRPGRPRVRARPEAVADTLACTALEENGVRVYTVEHLLAALYGLGVDNARIEIHGEEVPALDGSARGFARAIMRAGIKTLASPRRVLAPKRTLLVKSAKSLVRVSPAPRLIIDCAIDYPHPLVGRQRLVFHCRRDWFLRQIAPARTFGRVEDLDRLQRMGRARGASLENTLALGEKELLNPEGLRFHDEFVRHKILDILGDFSLLGARLRARITALASNHRLHAECLRKMLPSPG
jgi:UDP-3-O-[3-hydroxymyristoyl] N-acetylglucosamine deacetylase